ncbi:MAG: hypothetical protein HFI63_02070 [Lachnospiraceae bacterium]|nr:hypothetical protein [Lachnospiraceae bacterium]
MKCICDLFTRQGVLKESAGLTVSRPGLFCVEDERYLELYINLAARVGVECSGMERPVCKENMTDSICIRKNPKLSDGKGKLSVCAEGFLAEASSEKDLALLTEYLVSRFPIAPAGGLLSVKQALETEYAGPVSIKEAELLLPEGDLFRIAFEAGEVSAERSQTELLNMEYSKTSDFKKTDFKPEEKEIQKSDSYERVKPFLTQNLDRRICTKGMESAEIETESLLALALWESLSNFETVYPLAISEKEESFSCICFQGGENAELLFEGKHLIFGGSGQALSAFIDAYLSREEELERQEWLSDLEALSGGKKDLGQLASFLAMEGEKKSALITKGYTAGVLREDSLDSYLAVRTGETVERKTCQTGKEAKRWNFEFSWEGQDFWSLFEEKALPLIKQGDQIEISGRLSEDADVRRRLEERLRHAVEETGAKVEEASIYRAFKSGSCWIEETVLPKLSTLGTVKRVEIQFLAFVNEFGEESFEDESIPNYGSHGDHPQKWFDISTRWLQELFPVDEVLAKSLSISTEDVEFQKRESGEHTYVLKAFDETGTEVFQDFFDVKYVEKDYMSRYPMVGKTHVTTGWLSVKKNGRTVVEERIVTDTEKVWEAVETTVLPELEALLVSRYSVSGLLAAQPLFNRLQIRTSLSEVDYDTGIREERMSTLENLQEDLYFYILDWFKTYGERECGGGLDNVGLILPELSNQKEQNSRLEVILYEDSGEQPCGCLNGVWKDLTEEEVRLIPERLCFRKEDALLQVKLSTSHEEEVFGRLEVLKELLEKNVLNYYPDSSWKILVKGKDREEELSVFPAKAVSCSLSTEEKERMLRNDVIDYEGYQKLLSFYSRYKEFQIRPLETSFQGRKLYYLLYIKKEAGICYREEKLKINRMTVLFNGRHHGNEASSLNSAFLLLDRLLEDEELKKLCLKVNLLTLPWENLDGGELHCQVQKEHPKWLCHPARYNSAGFEFRKDYNNPDTIYGEARAVKKLWRRWLFDVVTDNHGFEGHEMTQPFSGYSSPWYKGFWIPKALYYGYIWFDCSHEHTISFGNRVRNRVADFINADKEIRERNWICLDRFRKYAENWFPDRFHTDAFRDVIFYWIDTNKQKRPANFNLEYPEVTTLDWTTEVADETVTGKEMWLNVRAHLLSDLALLQVLKETELFWDCQTSKENGPSVYTKFRRRPLL